MNILVICVNAENGGAETILRRSCEEYKKDRFNTYYVCTSLVNVENSDNVINLAYPSIKKSYINRAYFDFFTTRKLIKQYSIDKIISLQNIGIFYSKLPQTLYIQQSLPFSKIRYSIFDSFKYWFYQNVFYTIMKYSLKYVDEIVVHTKWMKNAIHNKCNYDLNKIIIDTPIIHNKYNYYFDYNNCSNTFFYPTSNESYKRYDLIFLAIDELFKKVGYIDNIKVILTLNIEQLDKQSLDIYNKYKNTFNLVGYISEEELYKYYSSSVLVFASETESLGLPILEAMSTKSPIIAPDLDYAKELLVSYNDVNYFEQNDYKQLSNVIEGIVNKHGK